MSDTKNVKLGVCKVTYDGVDLGYTKGGVEVSVTTETHRTEVDQFGKSPISETIMGRDCKVKVPLAETTLDNLIAIMPGATLVTDGADPLKKRVDVTNGIGYNLLDNAKILILHPQALADNDYSQDFNIPLAATPGALTFAYKLDDERIFNTEFSAYPNAATKRLFSVGDLLASAKTFTADAATETFSSVAHGYANGDAVALDSTGALPAPLVARRTYFIASVTADAFRLAYTAADAIAGVNLISITDAGTGTLKVSKI